MIYKNIQGSLANFKLNDDLVGFIDLCKMLTDKYGLDEIDFIIKLIKRRKQSELKG